VIGKNPKAKEEECTQQGKGNPSSQEPCTASSRTSTPYRPEAPGNLVADFEQCLEMRTVHLLIAIAAFNLDFLCIHPFRDGNGRVSRLLLVLMLLSAGYEVGRYISLVRLIEENKERYYEVLELSSAGWHEGMHDPWPLINHLLYILKTAYKEFESRAMGLKPVRGEKRTWILKALESLPETFSMAELAAQCTGISLETVRKTIKGLRMEGKDEYSRLYPGSGACACIRVG